MKIRKCPTLQKNPCSFITIGNVFNISPTFGLKVIADNSVFKNEKIIFNAGDRSYSIAMKSEDWRNVVNPRVAEII